LRLTENAGRGSHANDHYPREIEFHQSPPAGDPRPTERCMLKN
jgi:hypothetical protein